MLGMPIDEDHRSASASPLLEIIVWRRTVVAIFRTIRVACLAEEWEHFQSNRARFGRKLCHGFRYVLALRKRKVVLR